MRNAIARIEKSIAEGTYPERVLPIRVYGLTMSPVHIEAGTDWRLLFSTTEHKHAVEFIEDEGCSFDLHMIVGDGIEAEIKMPRKS